MYIFYFYLKKINFKTINQNYYSFSTSWKFFFSNKIIIFSYNLNTVKIYDFLGSTSILTTAISQTISSINIITIFASIQLPLSGSMKINKSNIDLTVSRLSGSNLGKNFTSGKTQIYVPDPCASLGLVGANCTDTDIIEQAFFIPNAPVGTNGNNQVNVINSALISLTYFESNMNKLTASSVQNGFYFSIPKKTSMTSTSFQAVNLTSMLINSPNQVLSFYVNLTSPYQSITINLAPGNQSVAYLVVLKYGRIS